MTYERLVGAVPAFQKLVNQDLPLPVAYRLSKTIKKVNEELDFFQKESEKIRVRHEDPNSPGINRELLDLLSLDVEWGLAPLRIEIANKLRLSCSDVNALDGFVEFYEEEENHNA
jgi:hypothetical protein